MASQREQREQRKREREAKEWARDRFWHLVRKEGKTPKQAKAIVVKEGKAKFGADWASIAAAILQILELLISIFS